MPTNSQPAGKSSSSTSEALFPRRLFSTKNRDPPCPSIASSPDKRPRSEIEGEKENLKCKIKKLEEDLEDAAREVAEKESEIMSLKEDLEKFRQESHSAPIADRNELVVICKYKD